ncbi:hypothetical protein HOR51_gp08 [Ralstonia phage phiAp1]|uniref:Uncharacterized protein n=1 Tax=Ralstonia phage phiAp1 TaxID=2783867 RepID=A0A1L7DS23_9CAUD|nr:hypothetical protein HOR51_gp08 [Ralstonia phage phiAp1]APU03149.1 hypothetical protein phiAp1_08 [Ralstonia phage phiAp1]
MITVNVGLWTDGGPVMGLTARTACRVLDENGFTVLKSRMATDTESGEPTLIAVLLDDIMDGTARSRLYKVAEELIQDCIAFAVNFGDPCHFAGALVGPRASKWGRFDPLKFSTWEGKPVETVGVAFKEAA